MAVSSVRVTEGSGPYLHTWQRSISSVNREDQYVQLGEPALPTYVIGFEAVTTTTAAHIVQIMSGASTYTRIHKIEVYVNDWPASTSLLQLQVVRLTSAGTGGTTGTPSAFDTADTASATCMSLPTVKGTEGTGLMRLAVPMGTDVSAAQYTTSWEALDRGKPLIIPSGTTNGICLKVVTGIASSGVVAYVYFTETAWL